MKRHRRLFIVIVVFIIGIVAIFYSKQFFQCSQEFYSGVLGSILATFFAAFLVWVAWEEWGKLSKISSADFIHKLKSDFFTRETRTLVSLIDCNALEFKEPENNEECSEKENPQSYFEVNQYILEKTKLPEPIMQRLTKRKFFASWDIDDLLLGHFEDIGMLEQKGIIDFQMVYDEFSWYLETVWNNEHIKNYIRSQRPNEEIACIDMAIYNQFQYIAVKCLEYEGLHSGPCMWWWKVKRYFRGPKIKSVI